MNDLQIFKNEEFGTIRTVEVNNKPYFVASDVARALGYSIPSKAIQTHCKGVSKVEVPTDGGKQEMLIIPEGDIYRLIVKSQMPFAEKFESWVFDEVLPSIRKHGMYATDDLLNDPDLAIKAFTALKEERERTKQLQTEIKVKNQIIGELQPKADYTDTILKNKGLVTTTQIAKDYGMSAHEMNDLLHNLDIQYKQSEQWLLYSKYHGMGYTHSETVNITRSNGRADIKMNTKWTQKGRLFIYEALKKEGIVPTIEREEIA